MAVLAEEKKQFFKENGYLVLEGAYQGERLRELRDAASDIRDRVRAHQPEGTRYWPGNIKDNLPNGPERGGYTWGVNEIIRQELFDPTIVNGIGDEPVAEVVDGLLEEPRIWGLKILWAPTASEYDLIWHRDIGDQYSDLVKYKPGRNDHIQFNAALEPDSSFIVIPGSHRRDLTEAEKAQLRTGTGELPGQIRVELNPGDIVFMDAHAYHRGQADQGAPRLSLHYSAQAQWVPLKPWGKPEDFAWQTSDPFLDQLSPKTRVYYERLKTAVRTDDVLGWLVSEARDKGWKGKIPS